ncbi:MAG: hypothetical protein KAR40_01175 [Candidatus Sabulitectum sp.]|nr:hypothetical protein [Candidatus Sabulitectum sp.]
MRLFMCVLLIVAVTASAGVRTGGTGMTNPWSTDGTYTVTSVMAGGLKDTYGMAIKDNVANSIWLLNYVDMLNYEYDMVGGSATGTSWAITGGVDPDDQAYCEYTSGNQWFMTNYDPSFFSVFAEDGSFVHSIDGPAAWGKVFGVGAGHDMMYLGGNGELAWGTYTGTETTITWTTMVYEAVYGLAVYGDFLFVACGIEFADNVFIHEIAADGTPGATPVWSCSFVETADGTANGGIDYDGEYLWLYPQNDFLYKVEIDWSMALESDTWAAIKSSF